MDKTAIYQLALDTLTERRAELHGCFHEDPARRELEEVGLEALPVIEQLVFEDVLESCPWEEWARHLAFPGLGSLLAVYFAIANRCGRIAEVGQFLERTYGGTRCVALDVLDRLIYRETPIPPEVLVVVRGIAVTGATPERAAAEKFLSCRKYSV